MEKMAEIMARTRGNAPKEIGGLKVLEFSDYKVSKTIDLVSGKETEITLPKSDVLVFGLEGGASVIIRPSGTEPKIKVLHHYRQGRGGSQSLTAEACGGF